MTEREQKQEMFDRFLEMMQGVYLQMRPNLPKEWVKIGLTALQIRTITLLSRGPKRASEIAFELDISPSSATGVIDHLVNKRLVERFEDPNDRRLVMCQLTRQGRRQVQQFWRINRERLERVAGNLSAEEISSVVRALEILRKISSREQQD